LLELQALLFDLDGTLVDTADANYAAYAAALEEAGVSVDREAFDRVALGRHWRQFLPGLIGSASVDAGEVAARKRAIYPTMTARTRLNQPLLALAKSQQDRLKLGLVTSASRASVTAVFAAHDLHAVFETVVTGDDVEQPKPAPESYLLAARRLSVEPGRCLAIEDSETGLESARRAGMLTVQVRFPSSGSCCRPA
jgi:beta-phosphoglucomutase